MCVYALCVAVVLLLLPPPPPLLLLYEPSLVNAYELQFSAKWPHTCAFLQVPACAQYFVSDAVAGKAACTGHYDVFTE